MNQVQTLFFSWQSDLSKETNQNAIRHAIKEATNWLESDCEDLHVLIDEATRGMSGSQNIPLKIFDKISNSDIFICDISTINKSDSENRKVPNPNVLVELGYAVAKLGWPRIILLFNIQFGDFPKDLPFDIDRQRASKYQIKDKNDKQGKKDLSLLLKTAIKAILEDNPEKECDKAKESEENKKRRLDVANIKLLMSQFHINSFDFFLEHMPNFIPSRILIFKEGFAGVMNSNHFYLYNKTLFDLLVRLRDNWEKSLSFSEHYGPDNSGKGYMFYIPGDIFPDEKAEKDYHYLVDLRIKLSNDLKEVLNYIRKNYLEIDLNETSKIAFENYLNIMNEE